MPCHAVPAGLAVAGPGLPDRLSVRLTGQHPAPTLPSPADRVQQTASPLLWTLAPSHSFLTPEPPKQRRWKTGPAHLGSGAGGWKTFHRKERPSTGERPRADAGPARPPRLPTVPETKRPSPRAAGTPRMRPHHAGIRATRVH